MEDWGYSALVEGEKKQFRVSDGSISKLSIDL